MNRHINECGYMDMCIQSNTNTEASNANIRDEAIMDRSKLLQHSADLVFNRTTAPQTWDPTSNINAFWLHIFIQCLRFGDYSCQIECNIVVLSTIGPYSGEPGSYQKMILLSTMYRFLCLSNHCSCIFTCRRIDYCNSLSAGLPKTRFPPFSRL